MKSSAPRVDPTRGGEAGSQKAGLLLAQQGGPWLENVEAVVLAQDSRALVRLCGVSMLERTLRVLQRLGFTSVFIVNASAEAKQELKTPSWPRGKLNLEFAAEIPRSPNRLFILRGEMYYDPRILNALSQCAPPTVAVDSNPPAERRALLSETPTRNGAFLCGARLTNSVAIDQSEADAILDVAGLPAYIGSIRRTIHPLWFPAPTPEHVRLAEDTILDSATKGTPDIPSILQAPVETWITRHVCRTRVTPNQVTIFSSLLGLIMTWQFVEGRWWSGALMAVVFGILDGVDGKLARVKVETTKIGKWEHYIDHALEYSWWLAMAYSLGAAGRVSHAWLFGIMVIAGDLLGKIVTRPVMAHTGKPSHDFSRFEQRLRLVGGRRDIYIAIFLIGLVIGAPGQAFAAIGCWSVITALIQTVRSIYICFFTPRLV